MANAPIALVGGESLLGADVRDRLAEDFRGVPVKLVGTEDEMTAILTEQGGEAVVMTGMDEETLGAAKVVLLAGSAESSRRAMAMIDALAAPPMVIDANSPVSSPSNCTDPPCRDAGCIF